MNLKQKDRFTQNQIVIFISTALKPSSSANTRSGFISNSLIYGNYITNYDNLSITSTNYLIALYGSPLTPFKMLYTFVFSS